MNKLGRPTKLNKTTVQKLTDGFRLGMNVSQVCTHANISRSSFYTYVQNNPEFSDKIDYEKSYLLLKARSIVSESLESGDLKTAKWFLEQYDPDRTALKVDMQDSDEQELTPAQLNMLQETMDALIVGVKQLEECYEIDDEYHS